MQKRNLAVMAIMLVLFMMIVPTYISVVSSATGYIRINGKSASTIGQQVHTSWWQREPLLWRSRLVR